MKFPKRYAGTAPGATSIPCTPYLCTREGRRGRALGGKAAGWKEAGLRGQKFPELIRTAKTTKKATLRLKCKECNREMMTYGIRLRKAEIAA